jgi:REP element-mobilizing transposase RayT
MGETMSDGDLARRGQRKHPTHGVLHVDGQPTVIFDTVCTKDRVAWLTNDVVHQILRDVWRAADAWHMGRYVIMPDHIHFFAAATISTIPYDNWVRYWKSQFTKRYKVSGHDWLADHWDVRMRSAAHYEDKWLYVRRNPVRHGLVASPDHWPYQGEIHLIRWD